MAHFLLFTFVVFVRCFQRARARRGLRAGRNGSRGIVQVLYTMNNWVIEVGIVSIDKKEHTDSVSSIGDCGASLGVGSVGFGVGSSGCSLAAGVASS